MTSDEAPSGLKEHWGEWPQVVIGLRVKEAEMLSSPAAAAGVAYGTRATHSAGVMTIYQREGKQSRKDILTAYH